MTAQEFQTISLTLRSLAPEVSEQAKAQLADLVVKFDKLGFSLRLSMWNSLWPVSSQLGEITGMCQAY